MFKIALFIFSIFIISTYARSDAADDKQGWEENRKNEFNIYILAIMWPQTVWWSINKKWKEIDDKCTNMDAKNLKPYIHWTIHGLWPENTELKNPALETKNTFVYEFTSNPSLYARMNNKWINFQSERTNADFWAREWNNHGRFAALDPNFASPDKYFAKTLELFCEHDIKNILELENITPTKVDPEVMKNYESKPSTSKDQIKFKYSDIRKALKKHLKVDVVVKCVVDQNKVRFLKEIFLCFDKQFKLTHCSEKYSEEQIKNSCLLDYNKKTQIGTYKDDVVVLYPQRLPPCEEKQ